MVTLLAPVATGPTYVKVANFPGLYRHARSGRYYACKKLGGIRRERSSDTCDHKIAERRMKEWLGSLEKAQPAPAPYWTALPRGRGPETDRPVAGPPRRRATQT